MPTIIDGYNLIFTCGLEGKTRTPQSLERARTRLISTAASRLKDSERSATTIVFDAKRLPVKESEADSVVLGIRVMYAIDYEDADTLIEELIRQHSTPKQLTVVSSDHRIQTAATRRKATAIDSDVWWERLLESLGGTSTNRATIEPDEKQPAGESLKSIDWVNEFNLPDNRSDCSTTSDDREQPSRGDDIFNPFPPGYGEDLLDDQL